ncbi:retrovirus-related pol polyprotein from transposon TNT 1-94 [Tanacetum coccineum]
MQSYFHTTKCDYQTQRPKEISQTSYSLIRSPVLTEDSDTVQARRDRICKENLALLAVWNQRTKTVARGLEKTVAVSSATNGIRALTANGFWSLCQGNAGSHSELKEHQRITRRDDDLAALANLIANLTLDTEENKTTQARLSLEKYTTLMTKSDYKILQTKLNETLGLLALKDIDIQEGLKTKTYEISVVNQKHDELVKKSLLTRSQFEGQLKEKSKVISDLKVKEGKDIDTMIEMDKQIKFLNEILYKRNQSIQTIHMLAPKCATYNGRSTFANPKYLKIAQSEKPRLYEIPYDTSDPANRFCPNGEETVTLEKESRSKLDKDKVVPNNSQVKFQKKEVEDHHRISSISKKTKSVTACNDSSNSRTSNENAVCAECGTWVFNSNHEACAFSILERREMLETKKPNVVPISASKPREKRTNLLQHPIRKKTTYSSPICLWLKLHLPQAWFLGIEGFLILTSITSPYFSKKEDKAVPSSKRKANLFNMDLCGPMRVASINGKKYILVIIADYSRYTWTLFLRSKDETPEVLKDFLTMIQRTSSASVLFTVRTDRRHENFEHDTHTYFIEEALNIKLHSLES